MAAETFLFLDFDDTLSDFRNHNRQFVHNLADLLAGEYGGDNERWVTAIGPVLEESIALYTATFAGDPLGGYRDWVAEERVRVAKAIFMSAGKSLPPSELLNGLAQRLQFDALIGCNAAFPDAEETLRRLFEAGVRIQMASSQESEYLLAALMGAGVESFIESKFGPDLVDCAKEGAEFYRRIFRVCNVHPSQAIVVDDQAICLDWAEEAGAKVIQAHLLSDSPEPEFPRVITHLSDLLRLVNE